MEKILIGVRKEDKICKTCGQLREFYFLSDFSYGETLILIKGGTEYAYENMLHDAAFNEVDEIFKEICQKRSVIFDKPWASSEAMQRTFAAACDNIDGEEIDMTNLRAICKYCGGDSFISNYENSGPAKVEVSVITHNHWNTLSRASKYKAIENKMKALGYIS